MSDFAAAPGSEPAERVTDNGRRTPAVLVIDDEADLRELISLTIVAMGFDVDAAESLGQARALLAGRRYALCLSDIRLTDGNGLDLLREVVATGGPPVAMMTAYGSAENAVAALKAGAFDYLSKPVDLAQLRLLVRSVLDPQARAAAAQAGQSAALERMIGETPAMRALRVLIGRLGMSMAPVAVYGESGSGKELVARAIHEASARRAAPFVAVNCGAIPENLMEAEFFGYRRGAFTGADRDRDGFFQAAAGGTLFLDEVAELPLPMQVKLLRAIQERRVRKVGATGEEPVDVRLISATHQDLARLVVAGRFRQDLFYRLNVIEVRVPSLRERADDIPVLAERILGRLAQRAGVPAPSLGGGAIAALRGYPFPGNVRELENVLERAIALAAGDELTAADLLLPTADIADDEADVVPAPATATESAGAPAIGAAIAEAEVAPAAEYRVEDGVPSDLTAFLDDLERKAIRAALVKSRNNRTAAAQLLGLTFRQLRYRMQRLALK